MAFLNSYRFRPSRSGAALRWLFTGIPFSDLVQQLPTVPQAVVITEFRLELSFLRFKRLLVGFPGKRFHSHVISFTVKTKPGPEQF